MQTFLFRLAVFGPVLFAAAGSGPANAANPQTDTFGDPLPDGAVARLGTRRWRCARPVEFLRFVADGKELLFSCGDGVIHVMDAATGKEIRQFGTSGAESIAMFADGATIAQATPHGRVHVWSVAAGTETRSFYTGKLSGVSFIKRDQLAGWADARAIKVWDVRTGRLARVLRPEPSPPPGSDRHGSIGRLVASPDGTSLAFVMDRAESPDRILTIWDLKDSKPTGEIVVADRWYEVERISPAFSPDGRYVAWPEQDGTIQLYRSPKLEKVRSLGKPSKDGRAHAVEFSEDGKTLAAVTPTQTIRLFDVGTGGQVREIGEKTLSRDDWESRPLNGWHPGSGPAPLAWSTRSNHIAQGWEPGLIRIWDLKTDKGNDLASGHFGPIAGLLVSPDGKTAVTLGSDNTVRTWQIAIAIEKRRVVLPPTTTFGALLGPRHAVLQNVAGWLSVWDIETQKEAALGRRDKDLIHHTHYALSRDGKSLLAAGEYHGLMVGTPRHTTLYDLETRVERPGVGKNWTKRDSREGDIEEELVSLAHASRGHPVVATIGICDPAGAPGLGPVVRYQIRCKQSAKDRDFAWETKVTNVDELCRVVSFTPDDRSILTFNLSKRTRVSLLEAVTGNERCRFTFPHQWDFPVHAFSSDGHLLALGTVDGTTLIDIRRGRTITRLNGNQGEVRCLAFGPDAATLFTAGTDGTVLIWDLSKHLRKAQQTLVLSPGDAKRLWAELADSDTLKAYRAVATLVQAPAQVVALFREKLRPVKQVPAADIVKLIADLDDERFETRKTAFHELRQIGPQTRPALTKRLETTLSLEQRKRLDELLAELRRRELAPSQEELREMRAIEVLEVLATPQAQSLLESLANGAPATRLTDDAAAALTRQKGGLQKN